MLPDLRAQTRLVDWATKPNRDSSYTECGFVEEVEREKSRQDIREANLLTRESPSLSFRGAFDLWPRY